LVRSPQESLAVVVTVVVPTGKELPLGGTLLIDGGGLQPPLAEVVKYTTAPLELVAVATIFDEQSMVSDFPVAACERTGANSSRLATTANKILLVFMAKLHLIMVLIDLGTALRPTFSNVTVEFKKSYVHCQLK
jgi:hypothetical protein